MELSYDTVPGNIRITSSYLNFVIREVEKGEHKHRVCFNNSGFFLQCLCCLENLKSKACTEQLQSNNDIMTDKSVI